MNVCLRWACLTVAAGLLTAGTCFAQKNLGRAAYIPPKKVSVMPIIHVPKDVPAPDDQLATLVARHLKWTQQRYGELLGTTFEIAEEKPRLYRGKYTLQQYREFDNRVGAYVTAQHLDALKVTRFNCPYVLFTVFYNPQDAWPSGRGGPMNGGLGTGGGTCLIPSSTFLKKPNAQSTLQHEIGHAFGLLHVDAYGYALRGNNPSIMAYNSTHKTNGFRPAPSPGVFIPEDLRGLARNDLALPNLEFIPSRDIPANYDIHPRIALSGGGRYPGHPDYAINVTTTAEEAKGSKVSNAVLGRIEDSPGPKITYDSRNMWNSGTLDGLAQLDLEFPFPVELSTVRIYSGHSGRIHPVKHGALLRLDDSGNAVPVAETKFVSRDGVLTFPAVESARWRLILTPGKSKKVVVRGIRFWSGEDEIFRPRLALVEPRS